MSAISSHASQASYLEYVDAQIKGHLPPVPTRYGAFPEHALFAAALGHCVAVIVPGDPSLIQSVMRHLALALHNIPFAESASFNHVHLKANFLSGGGLYFVNAGNIERLQPGLCIEYVFVL